jgi:hypothetical protein
MVSGYKVLFYSLENTIDNSIYLLTTIVNDFYHPLVEFLMIIPDLIGGIFHACDDFFDLYQVSFFSW